MRLAITGPTRDIVPASFALDIACLYAWTKERGPWSTVTLGFVVATYIHAGREHLLESAIVQGADHVLWIDTDMSFPPDAAIRLARHNRPIVACNYVSRDGQRTFVSTRGGQRVPTLPESTGLEAVDTVGFGLVLMRTDVVEGLGRPWFVHGRNGQGGDIGEDWMFCRALRALGREIFIDHDVSQEIGHVGQCTYRTTARAAAITV
jgi:hypothetical protein